MPANLKEVRGRISSVKSTQQITKAMKMVSAAKLRRATERITKIRPYSLQLNKVLSNIMDNVGDDVELNFGKERPVKRVLIVAITSDRGLCGAFNTNVVKATKTLLEEKYTKQHAQGNVELMCVGKKGYDGLKKSSASINTTFQNLFSDLTFAKASEASEYIMNAFLNESVDRVEVVYGEFKNAAVQFTKAEQFLPVVSQSGNTEEKQATKADYIFEPGKEQILDELIPKILKTQFFRFLLDTNASEHGARMTAMDKATDNAGELLKELKLTYNRARQAAITTEISEIVSGAAALSEE